MIERALRVATFNVQHGVGPGGRTHGFDETIAAAGSLDADVLCLQEVDALAPTTHPAEPPEHDVDHILSDGVVVLSNARTVATLASDHLPVARDVRME